METVKKTKIIGQQDYINKDTGEIETMNVISVEERDVNFHKVWLGHIVQSLELVGNQKIKTINFLLEMMDSENKICLTIRQMAEKSKISQDTISRTINILKKADFIRSINIGAYQINPNAIFKGSKDKRLNVLYQYQQHKQCNQDMNKKTDDNPQPKNED